MFNFAADSDIYQWVSSGDAHKQPVPWTEASWPEGGRQTEKDMEGDGEKRERASWLLIEIQTDFMKKKHRIFNLV